MGKEWRNELHKIADGWMFDDVDCSFPERILIPFENPDYFNWEAYHSKLEDVRLFKAIAIGFHAGKEIGIMKAKFGSAAVCFTVDLLARRKVKEIVGVGYCGGIHPDFDSGTIILSSSATRVSCCSKRYLPIQADIEPTKNLSTRISSLAKSIKLPINPVRTYSSDDILLEDSNLINTLYRTGIHGIDMECGALYSLGQYFNLSVAAMLVVSDNPLTGKRADYSKVDQSMKSTISLALNALVAE